MTASEAVNHQSSVGPCSSSKAAPSGRLGPIERRSFPGTAKAFHATDKKENRPLVYEGYASSWPALQKWSLAWFLETFGDQRVNVNTGAYVPRPGDEEAAYAKDSKIVTLRQFVDSWANPPREGVGYVSGFNLDWALSELRADIDFPRVLNKSIKQLWAESLWISRAGTITQSHFDRTHNLFVQVEGRKRFYFWRPERTKEFDPVQIDTLWTVMVSRHEVPAPVDASELPEPDYVVDLVPGDMLFIPYGWWHRVESLDACISINLWWWNVSMIATHFFEVMRVLGWQAMHRRRRERRAAS